MCGQSIDIMFRHSRTWPIRDEYHYVSTNQKRVFWCVNQSELSITWVLVVGSSCHCLRHLSVVSCLHLRYLDISLPGHNQSEISIILCQPIRDLIYSVSTNQSWVLPGHRLHQRSIVRLQLEQSHGERRVDQIVIHISKHLEIMIINIRYKITIIFLPQNHQQ